MREAKFEFTLSGFVIAIIMIGMITAFLGAFVSDVQAKSNLQGETSLAKYNSTNEIINITQQIQDSTDFEQQQGILDVIGGFFSAGYASLKVSLTSFSLFSNLIDDAGEDIEILAFFKTYIVAIILIALFLGIAVSVLLKMRI